MIRVKLKTQPHCDLSVQYWNCLFFSLKPNRVETSGENSGELHFTMSLSLVNL